VPSQGNLVEPSHSPAGRLFLFQPATVILAIHHMSKGSAANTNQRHTPLGDLIEYGMKGVKVLQLFTAKKHFHYRERIVIK
jgi:hypothetical protein